MRNYEEIDRGRFESALILDGEEIAFTDCGDVYTGRGYIAERDADAVREYAGKYDFEVIEVH